jgi:hypothetical protein
VSNGWEVNLRDSNISDSDISEGGNSTDNQPSQERKERESLSIKVSNQLDKLQKTQRQQIAQIEIDIADIKKRCQCYRSKT